VPAEFRAGLLSHNDPNLDNVIFSGGRAVALIDFDLAGPGSAAWDVACAARLWAPLRDERDAPAVVRGRALERLRTFVDAYGAPPSERTRIVDAVIHTHDWAYEIVRAAVARGHRPFRHHWYGGGHDRADRTRVWIDVNHEEMAAALGEARH
jgi:aminoglycoside phosphotransferase (APT) family kinase protein